MNFYEILGISPDASADEITSAYRKKRSENHPDKGGDKAMFDQVQKAYETLGNSSQRAIYDYVHGFTRQAKPHANPHAAPNEPKGQTSGQASSSQQANAKAAPKGPPRFKFKAKHFDASGFCKSCAGSGRLRVAQGYKTAIVSCVRCFGFGTNKI